MSPRNTPNMSLYPVSYELNELGHASLAGVDLVDLAQEYGTPLYVLDEATMTQMAKAYQETLCDFYAGESLVLYAAKANLSMGLCQFIQNQRLGLDVVSGGELYTAIAAGFPASNIFFNGNNKTPEELELAFHHQVAQNGRIIVDNFYELELLHRMALERGQVASILLRITPGIECHTHEYIKTGQTDSKFGFDISQLPDALKLITQHYSETLSLKGLHAHIGSQIFEFKPYEDLVEILLNIYYNIRQQYDGLTLTDINIGGGMGVAYTKKDSPLDVRKTYEKVSKKLQSYGEKLQFPLPRLLIEPGRSLVASAGMTLYTIGSSKKVPLGERPGKRYVAIDGGMGDNIRPSLYQAEYTAFIANRAPKPGRVFGGKTEAVTIAGKYCESGDILIKEVQLSVPQAGDILAVLGTGAYNYSMASNYNRIPRPATVIITEGRAELLVKRETYTQLMQNDVIPKHWVSEGQVTSVSADASGHRVQ